MLCMVRILPDKQMTKENDEIHCSVISGRYTSPSTGMVHM